MNDLTKSNSTSVIRQIINWDGWSFIITLSICVIIIGGFAYWMIQSDLKNYPYGNYEMTYRVYYTPSTFTDYTVTHNRPIYMGSHKGTNYIKKHRGEYAIQTNAPIQIIKYVNHKK